MNRIVKQSFWLLALTLSVQVSAQEKTLMLPTGVQDAVSKSVRGSAAGVDVTSMKPKDGGSESNKTATPHVPEKSETNESKAATVSSPQPLTVVGRRDPFRPITLNLRTTVRRRENLSPLERFELGQLKLVGIIWNIKNPTALVEDTTGLGYTVKVGTPIGSNDGKVKAINPDALMIEEDYIDLYGAKKKREVSMRLAAERAE